MKILIVSQYFWPENFIINDLALGFKEKGHDVTVLTGHPNYPRGTFFAGYGCFNFLKKRSEIYKGIKILRVPIFSRGNSKGIKLIFNFVSFFISASISAILFVRKDFDVIFAFQVSPVTLAIPAVILKKITKRPLIMWILDIWPESVVATENKKYGIAWNILVLLIKWIYKHCDKILVTSRGFIKSVVDRGYNSSDIIYFPNWANSNFEEQVMVPIPDFKFPEGFKIVFAGNLGKAQDLESLVAAAELTKEYSDIKWMIVGEGRSREWLQNEISKKCLEKTLFAPGAFPIETMPWLYNKADALLITLKKTELFSLTVPGKLQTYLASAKPILAMLDGEGAKIIDEAKVGYVAPAGDFHQLSKNAIKLFALNREELVKLGQNGRSFYEKCFNRNNLITQCDTLLKSLNNCTKKSGEPS